MTTSAHLIPYWQKDIEIHKGGYDARFGERVGGIVNIVGKKWKHCITIFYGKF